jgi:hypothetical protein
MKSDGWRVGLRAEVEEAKVGDTEIETKTSSSVGGDKGGFKVEVTSEIGVGLD